MKTLLVPLVFLSACGALCGCNRSGAVIAPVAAPVGAQDAPREKDREEKRPPAEQAKAPASRPSPFAGDRGEKLVGQLLAPSDEALKAEARKEREQRRWQAAAFLERPQLPLPPVSAPLPQLPVKQAAQPVRPGPLAQGPPLDRYRADPAAPRRPELPAGGPIAWPSPDLNQPVPLPILAKPLPDRAPLTDPTADVSVAAVLAAPVPLRTTPAPFVRINLPEPFEHVQTAKLRTPVEEDPQPPLTTPQAPVK